MKRARHGLAGERESRWYVVEQIRLSEPEQRVPPQVLPARGLSSSMRYLSVA
jgi:hypothetical protein